MDPLYILKALGALVFVMGLFYAAVLLLKKLQPSYFSSVRALSHKLKLEEQIYLGPKHRMAVVSYENKKYVLLLGETSVVIDTVESHIK